MPNRNVSARLKAEYIIASEDVFEPDMTDQDWVDFERGIVLFHAHEFWAAHEAWELVWKRHLEPSRIFFQGLIQSSAACYQVQRGIYHGALKHYNNALFKLRQFPHDFLTLRVGVFVSGIERCKNEVLQLGEEHLCLFSVDLFPKIKHIER